MVKNLFNIVVGNIEICCSEITKDPLMNVIHARRKI